LPARGADHAPVLCCCTLAARRGFGHVVFVYHCACVQADALIHAVHEALGRERSGRRRLGCATEEEPTRGGLRIGKEHPEGHADGDGQYFHYITKRVADAREPRAARAAAPYLSHLELHEFVLRTKRESGWMHAGGLLRSTV